MGFQSTFFEKGFGTAVALFDHADYVVTGVFAQAFFEKACRQAVFLKKLVGKTIKNQGIN